MDRITPPFTTITLNTITTSRDHSLSYSITVYVSVSASVIRTVYFIKQMIYLVANLIKASFPIYTFVKLCRSRLQ